MLNSEDWLKDPIKSRKLKSANDRQNDLWHSFHFATRLKLDAADHFCRQVLGAASMPDDLGLPLLAHRQLIWYLDAFFFELMSAYETLLQELNIVYAYDLGLKPEKVRWNDKNLNNFMKKLPNNILENIATEREKDWFYNVQRYRNTATHHYTVPLGSGKVGWGDKPWDYNEYGLSIYYLDDAQELKEEKVSVCTDYLKKMVRHIHQVWEKMAQEFE